MRLKAFVLRPPSASISIYIPSASSFLSHSAWMACHRPPVPKTNMNYGISIPSASSALFSTGADAGGDAGPSPTAQNMYGSSNRCSSYRPLWIDTDVGFDDLVAILSCNGVSTESATVVPNDTKTITTPTLFPGMIGISTVGGGLTSDPCDGVSILRGLLPVAFAGNSIPGSMPIQNQMPIVAGQCERTRSKASSGQTNAPITNHDDDPPWLSKCRDQMTDFCASEGIVPLVHSKRKVNDNKPVTGDDDEATATIHAMTKEAGSSNDLNGNGKGNRHRIDLVCLGPLTNLAHWLDKIPEFAPNCLNSVWILGGNIPIRRSSSLANEEGEADKGTKAEFNFARDPEAVRTVLHHPGLHGIPVYVVPQEVCDRAAFEGSFHKDRSPPHDEPTNTRAEVEELEVELELEFRDTIPSAATIIENWLQSSPSRLQSRSQAESGPPASPKIRRLSGDADTTVATTTTTTATVSSSLPTWMVRLIQTRTFSVYGDPICIYVRDHSRDLDSNLNSNFESRSINSNSNSNSDHNSDNNNSERRPKIRWKNYSATVGPGTNTEVLTVDAGGRLIVQQKIDDFEDPAERSSSMIPQDEGDALHHHHHDGKGPCGITIHIAHEVELGPVYLEWLARSLL